MSSSKDPDPSGDNPSSPDNPPQMNDPHTPKNMRRNLSGMVSSPGMKFFMTGFITLALLIPTMMVWGLVEERSRMADEVAQSIAQGWGARQLINGPYLVVPYTISEKADNTFKQVTRYAVVSPNTLTIDGDIEVEERKKSIYKTQLYHLKSNIAGKFASLDLNKISEIGGNPIPSQAFLALGVSDMTGIRSDIVIELKGIGKRKFLPGLKRLRSQNIASINYNRNVYSTVGKRQSGGVHLPMTEAELKRGFEFDLSFALNGSKDMKVIPAGNSTQLNLKSN